MNCIAAYENVRLFQHGKEGVGLHGFKFPSHHAGIGQVKGSIRQKRGIGWMDMHPAPGLLLNPASGQHMVEMAMGEQYIAQTLA